MSKIVRTAKKLTREYAKVAQFGSLSKASKNGRKSRRIVARQLQYNESLRGLGRARHHIELAKHVARYGNSKF